MKKLGYLVGVIVWTVLGTLMVSKIAQSSTVTDWIDGVLLTADFAFLVVNAWQLVSVPASTTGSDQP